MSSTFSKKINHLSIHSGKKVKQATDLNLAKGINVRRLSHRKQHEKLL